MKEAIAMIVTTLIIGILNISCATSTSMPSYKIVRIPVVVKPKAHRIIKPGQRIVILDLVGECATEVRDALSRRLIDNADYDVLTRDNLDQILAENKVNWSGDFNTTTVNRLGELLGASLFVVGRVNYCGQPITISSASTKRSEMFRIIAALQIIDLQTGKVIVSSSSEGRHVPGTASTVSPSTLIQRDEGAAENEKEIDKKAAKKARKRAKKEEKKKEKAVKTGITVAATDSAETDAPDAYLRLQAAENLANGFADKFFARPTWQYVEMWEGPQEEYNRGIRQVKLGHCPEAVDFFQTIGKHDINFMSELEVAKYLHNFGVALVCANRVDLAVRKLRSAYRVDEDESTLKMMDFANKIVEWSLVVEVDEEPEIGVLMRRGRHYTPK